MDFAQKAKQISQDLNYDKEFAKSLSLIGTVYSALGDYDNSSRFFFISLKRFEKLGDREGTANVLCEIGVDFFSQQYYKKALVYYKKALIITEKLDDQSLIKKLYNNTAAVYGALELYDTAMVFYNKALVISQHLGDKLGQGINTMNIGYIQMNTGNYDKALFSFHRSLELLSEVNNKEHVAECNLNLGFCHYSMNEIDKSINYFEKALQEGFVNSYFTVIYESSKMLNQIYIFYLREVP